MRYQTKEAAEDRLRERILAEPTKAEGRTAFQVKQGSVTVDMNARTFEGLASTWDLDRGGDIVHRGAFRRTLSHWRRANKEGGPGRIIPLLDQHRAFGSVEDAVGRLIDAKETAAGLEVKFEVVEDAKGDAVLKRLEGGFVDGLSIGYRPVVIELPDEKERNAGVWRHLKEVELREISVVIFPMNEGARVKEDPDGGTEAHRTPGSEDDPPADGLAPDDAKRLEAESRLRSMKMRRLAGRRLAPGTSNRSEP